MRIYLFALFCCLNLLSLHPASAEVVEAQGNHLHRLSTGAELNQHRLKLIKEAHQFIYLKTFIINNDPSEYPVFEALCLRARTGLDVRMLVDDLGRTQGGNPIKWRGPYSVEWFRSCGIHMSFYGAQSWGIAGYAIYSQHDKMLVTENGAIMGGTNFSRDYSTHGRFGPTWYDYDVAIEGPASCVLQRIFTNSWLRIYKKELQIISRLPHDTPKVMRAARIKEVKSEFAISGLNFQCDESRQVGKYKIVTLFGDPYFTDARPHLDYFLESIDQVISGNKEKIIRINAPYFVPSKTIVNKLIEARQHGVRVMILTNSQESIDPEAAPAYAAMLLRTEALVNAGVEIYLWKPSKAPNSPLKKDNIFHRKGGCFSSYSCFVGSHNFDVRGDEYSTELLSVLDDPQFVSEEMAAFDFDITYTVRMTPSLRLKLMKEAKASDLFTARIAGWAM